MFVLIFTFFGFCGLSCMYFQFCKNAQPQHSQEACYLCCYDGISMQCKFSKRLQFCKLVNLFNVFNWISVQV